MCIGSCQTEPFLPMSPVLVPPAQKQALGGGAARLGTALLLERKNQSSTCNEGFCREELPEQAQGRGLKPSLSELHKLLTQQPLQQVML